MDLALVVAELSVAFGSTQVIRALGFGVPVGSTLAIIGPDGSGRTVPFRALIGAIRHAGPVRRAR